MAIANFIPQVWSARLQDNLHNALVFGTLCNRNYEGDIAQYGDTVHINTLDDIVIKPYDPALALDEPDTLSGSDAVLTIDHGAYYNFYINDVDTVQAKADVMDSAMRNAANRLAADAEAYIIQTISEQAGITESASIPTAEEGGLYSLLLQVKSKLDEKGVPRFGRKLVIPPSLETTLLLDNRFITGSNAAAANLANGSVARAAGFDIYISYDLTDKLFAFIPEAVTFANQITKVEAYRPEKGFCDGVKGLCLSGCMVTIPDAVALYYITE